MPERNGWRIRSQRLLCMCLLMLISAHGLAAQERAISKKQLPRPVLDAFTASYPHARIVGCSREVEKGVTLYEVESKEGATHRDVTYKPDGAVVSVEESLPFDLAPQPVREAIAKAHPKATVLTSERVEKDGNTSFEFLIRDGKRRLELQYREDGTLKNSEKK
jgi:hypothetical protein